MSQRMTADEEATIIMLYREGLLHAEITERCGISKATVYEVLKRNHVPIDRRKGRTETTGGYVKILLSPDHPCYSMAERSGYIKEHRLVMALHLGRLLEPDEQIHHINGHKGDNRIANLQLVFRGHGNGVVMKCRACGSYDIEPVEKAQAKRMGRDGVQEI